MKKNKNVIFIFMILFLTFEVYSQNLKSHIFMSNYYFYQKCKKALKEENFYKAIFNLENIKKNNIINYIDDKVRINLIYAYYKVSEFNMAEKNIEEFIKLYPKHPNIDYIFYIKSLINISLDKKIYHNVFSIKTYKSNPIYATKAFFQLKNFIYNYPNSSYVVNAKKDLFYLKNRLSEYDLKILKYYFFQKKYIAVINRGEEILKKYPETLAAINALEYMKKSFLALKIFDTAEKISKIILLNKV
ncbi:outer membrane protein assembly factor BamD [Buchnera aphidicola]|uniref:Outer membrane protein assembly factor BamD n=1 Tax=Buchnera aphidicola subsp. Rhopalosiphum maidis TaxID=118109 RepID=A0A3G2I698_BUCRM|nr:outer membrane protein assembly factor BamD [Buchnera aphidicola]AYN24671.1 outer membrane protein assembly factor BamD [Buchnera aphidicola (Rhopalosiphum maidis)]